MLHNIISQGHFRPHHVVETRNNAYPSILNIINFHQSHDISWILKKIYIFLLQRQKQLGTFKRFSLMIESTLVLWTETLPFYPAQDIHPQFDLKFTMSNIVYILVTHLCMCKKCFPYVFYILQRSEKVWKKYFQAKFRELGPTKTLSGNNWATKCSWLTYSPVYF